MIFRYKIIYDHHLHFSLSVSSFYDHLLCSFILFLYYTTLLAFLLIKLTTHFLCQWSEG